VWTDGDALARLLCSARIGLNLSVDDPAPSPAETHLSPRVYDVILHGLTLVTEDVPLCSGYLQGLTYHTFAVQDAPSSALSTIQSILSGPIDEATALLNRKTIAEQHTYGHRFETMLTMIA
jgi:hypothetical protein